MVLAACLVPVMWAQGITVAEYTGDTLDNIQVLDFVILLTAAIGVSTFLSSYILLGHPTAYVGSIFAIGTGSVFSNWTVFKLAVVPIILGAIAGYYLNRYTKYKIKQKENSNIFDFISLRIICVCGASLLTLVLIKGNCHWSGYLIYLLHMSLYLVLSLRGIMQRADTFIRPSAIG